MNRARLLASTPAGAIAAFLPAVDPPGGGRFTATVSGAPGHFVVGSMLAYGAGPPYERGRIVAIRPKPGGQVELEIEKEGGDALERALFVALLRTRRLAIERATVRVEAERERARKAGEPVFYVTREDAALVRG